MEVYSVSVNGFQPVFGFLTTRPIKNYRPITAASATTEPPSPPQTISTSIHSNGVEKHSEVRSKKNVSKHISKNQSVSHEARESAILNIQNSSDLAYALSRSGERLKAADLNVVLRHFGNLNRRKDLCQLFDWMQQHGKTNIASYSSYIKFIGRESNSMKALEIYNSIKDESTRNNVSVCNSTLYCLIKSGKFDSSLKLFNQMKQAGLVPDIVTYSTLLVGCAKVNGGYHKAMELVREIKSKGLHMDIVVYGTLISVCASNNQPEEAEKFFDEMKSEDHSPNVFHYSSLLNAYAANGNYEKADELIQEIRSMGIVLNKKFLGLCIKGTEDGELYAIRAIASSENCRREMIGRHVNGKQDGAGSYLHYVLFCLSVEVILTTLLKVYVKGGLFEKSRELLNELQSQGYANDEVVII